MFILNRHSAEISAFTAIRKHVTLNDTEDIARLYKEDTYETCLGEFASIEDARTAAKKFPTKRCTFQSNGATWLRVEWLEIAKTTEDDTEEIVEYIYPAEVGKPADGYASKGNLEDYVDGLEVAQMLHEVTGIFETMYYDDKTSHAGIKARNFADLHELLNFARLYASDAKSAGSDFDGINLNTCEVDIEGDRIDVAFSAEGEDPRQVEISVICALEFSKIHAEFEYKFD